MNLPLWISPPLGGPLLPREASLAIYGLGKIKALDMNKTKRIHKNNTVKNYCTRVWVIAELVKYLPHNHEGLRIHN